MDRPTNNDTSAFRVFVTVGTHEKGFPRFLHAVREVIPKLPHTIWIIQNGPTSIPSQRDVDTIPFLTHDEFKHQVASADVMLSQASPGNLFAAIQARTPAILFPRLDSLREAAGNHQVEFADHVRKADLALVATDSTTLLQALESIRFANKQQLKEKLTQIDEQSRKNTAAFVRGFAQAVDQLLS